MKRTEYSFVPGGLLAAFVLAAAIQSPALAQTDTKTLSGKTGTGKVMTRDELRACMKQQESLAQRKTELETRQNKIAAERIEIQKETDAIKAEQEGLSSRKGAVDALNARMTAFSDKVKDLQQRRDTFEASGRGGPTAERERRKLDKEAADIKKEEAELNAEREKIQAGGNDAVDKLNARVEAQQQVAQGWNDRSKKLGADQQAYEDDRINWIDSCGNRRYREDDEKAIKAGK
ncbi:hypothetical protein [Ideonella sp.]|uniref:hypothetical protein n=1 Tax=Ideonella sp. TaxID=1929293 RepID=UPI002B4936FD|nr:hypothetical protein [Ideonella sp.]HJV71081.1 hypothetical protein [Ideonella sp.]